MGRRGNQDTGASGNDQVRPHLAQMGSHDGPSGGGGRDDLHCELPENERELHPGGKSAHSRA